MPYEHKLFVPTVELKARIKSKHGVSPVDFTIIANSDSGKNTASIALLEQTANAFPKDMVRNLVCLHPERLIEHEILAQLQATIKLDTDIDDELNTFGYAFTLVQRRLTGNVFDKLISKVATMRDQTRIDVMEFFNELRTHQLKEKYPSFSAEELKTLREIYESIAEKAPWNADPELIESVCVQRAMASIYTQRARDLIEPEVTASIRSLSDEHVLEPLEYVDKRRAIAVFTTGGVASGKGSCLKLVSKIIGSYESNPVEWNQLVHHNGDRLKPFLQKPEEDPFKYSQYTYEEALLVKERVMQVVAEKSQELGGEKYPNFLHDQTKLKPEELREANQRYGEIDIVAISTDVNAAIERADLVKQFVTTQLSHFF